jgi:hypothetical protein
VKHGLVCFFITIVILVCSAGCDDNCIVCPGPPETVEPDYHFLYSFVGSFSTASVLTYSTKTGEVVDSVYYGGFPFWDVRFSKDGQFAYYTVGDAGNYATWITNFATGDTVNIVDDIAGAWIDLSHDEKYLLLSGATTLRILTLPDLSSIYEREYQNSWGECSFHPNENKAYAVNLIEDSLLILDVEGDVVTESKVPLKNSAGNPASAIRSMVSLNGKYLILTARNYPSPTDTYIQLRDTETYELLHEYRPDHRGGYLHPDGKRVFFIDCVEFEPTPGALWELNLETLLMTKVLDGSDVSSGYPLQGLDPFDMDITPDGKYAFLNGGGCGLGFGPVIKVDLDTYTIVDAIYPSLGAPRVLRINPKEIK